MKYLLIGGAGYIGSNVANLLLKNKQNELLIYDDLSTGKKTPLLNKVKFIKGSQCSYKQLSEAVKKFKPDVIMHFAAKIIVSESVYQPLEYYENNVGGMINILRVMKENKIKNLIFSSTAATYGTPKKIPINETDPTDPINPYGSSKLACEYLIKAAETAYGIKAVILRYFNVAGASDDFKLGIFNEQTTLLIPRIIMAHLDNKVFNIYGDKYRETKDGTCIRDFIHVVDLAEAHLLAAKYLTNKKNEKTITVNLGTNKGYSVKECLSTAEAIIKAKIKVKVAPARAGDPAMLLTKNNLAKKLLNWTPKKSLHDMIESEYRFRLNQRKQK